MSVDWLIGGALLIIGLSGLGSWLLSFKKVRHADLLQAQNEILLQEKDKKIAELNSRCHTLEADNFKLVAENTKVKSDIENQTKFMNEKLADIEKNKISLSSPLAKALIGKEVGDVAEYMAPGGKKSFEILKVIY